MPPSVGVLGGVRQIYLRRLGQFDATDILRGTENPTGCFSSPDGRALGFLTAGDVGLKKVSLADGLVVPLAADVDSNSGGAWGPDERIAAGAVSRGPRTPARLPRWGPRRRRFAVRRFSGQVTLI